jgi:beta-N-acetylhexosaminidase
MTALHQKIGQMLIVGFHGTSKEDAEVKTLIKQIDNHLVGGIILFKYNVVDPFQLRGLVQSLKIASEVPLFVSVDQEGGRVQRLNAANGFTTYPSAQSIAGMKKEEASDWYNKLAKELNDYGINFDFAPCVDLNLPGYKCPVIGELQRSYSSDPGKVIEYSRIMLEALKKNRVINCIKHFPGHGSAQGDSHEGYVDVSDTWVEQELIPFYELVKINKVDSVMTAHIFNRHLDTKNPATMSKDTLDKLRQAGFKGVIITDDLHMGAIQQHYAYDEALINSITAGCDMIILSNNKAAAMGVEGFEPDPTIAEKTVNIIVDAVKQGIIAEERINEAYQRIMTIKKLIA